MDFRGDENIGDILPREEGKGKPPKTGRSNTQTKGKWGGHHKKKKEKAVGLACTDTQPEDAGP